MSKATRKLVSAFRRGREWNKRHPEGISVSFKVKESSQLVFMMRDQMVSNLKMLESTLQTSKEKVIYSVPFLCISSDNSSDNSADRRVSQ